MKTLHRTRGLVHDLVVTRKGRTTTLWAAGGVRQTVFDSSAPHLPGLEYARAMLATLVFCPQAQSCLVLGLGGGSIPRMLLAARPGMKLEAVEIDPAVVELADRFFEVAELPRFTVHLEDAAAFLSHCTSRYGIIILDTYFGEQFPDQCTTRDFFKNARKCLLDDGVIATNWLKGDAGKQRALLDNMESVIGRVWQLPALDSGNLIFFAVPKLISRPAVISSAELLEATLPFENSVRRLAQRLRSAT